MWLGKLKQYPRTWAKREEDEISILLKKCNYTLPFEIHRSIRSLEHISYWKGSEYRTFLMYLGIVVLKNFLDPFEYEMFLKLHCAVTICSTNIYAPYLPLARKLFIDFIEDHIQLYGEGSITSNIHNLSHVVDDVEHFGALNTISTYDFENALHHLKLRLKQCNRPLEQIARRIAEISIVKAHNEHEDNEFPQLKHQFYLSEHPELICFRYLKYKPNAMLSSAIGNIKNKWFLTFENYIVEFHYVFRDINVNKHLIRGTALRRTESFFQKPFESKYLNIFLSDGEQCEPQHYELSAIKAKLFSLPYANKWVFIPLLHTL